MVLKTLEITPIFDVVARTFPTHKHMAVGRGGGNFKFSAKKAVFLISNGKNQISRLLALLRKTFGKIHWWPPWKNFFRRPCTEACKITPFL